MLSSHEIEWIQKLTERSNRKIKSDQYCAGFSGIESCVHIKPKGLPQQMFTCSIEKSFYNCWPEI